jgi:mono/diheme cytochrome c family protein
MSMMALHQMGGVPPDWKLTPPPGDVDAGRRAFVDFGCHSCHRVEGEAFSVKQSAGNVGPELTGMGAHHPPAYFAEAILSPDAILIEGPGYIGPDGHSVMPDYPEMTVSQLGDLVAYLSSLKTGGPHAGHVMTPPGTVTLPSNLIERPAPPPGSQGEAFVVQTYDIKPGRLAAFEAWWKARGAPGFMGYDGVLGVDTWVDFTRSSKHFTTVVAFRDQAAFQRFWDDPGAAVLGLEFDAFVGEHDHPLRTWAPIYRVPSLSTP